MLPLERRSFLRLFASLPFATLLPTQLSASIASGELVRSRTDRTGKAHKGPRSDSHLDFKVLSKETNGGMFVLEHMDMTPGGPPKHLHYAQDEWFYLVEGGEVVMEIGEKRLTLSPGDSVLAPRNVPHAWAYRGNKPGRMIMAFTPAGKIEAFFEETSKPGAFPGNKELMEAHGMKWVGPPLKL